jgi:alkylation response protein AidB-like acyl-CoA dehydrogenase
MESLSGYDQELWATLCGEIGVAALAIPEEYGGIGASLTETHVVLEELGRNLTPSPLLGVVLASQALLLSGDDDACRRLLPDIASGDRLAALAWPGSTGRWEIDEVACIATESNTAWLLTGEAHYVLDGELADVLLVAAQSPNEIMLFEVDPTQPQVTRQHTTTLDPTRRLALITLNDATGRLIGPAPLAQLRDVACVALSAEQVGAAGRALELTAAYTKMRVQFGQPIGAFQALQHRMADLHVLVEAARAVSYAAVTGGSLAQNAAIAKVYCSEAEIKVAAEMIQLHGGIGVTWEHDAQLYFKRAHGAAHLFGPPSEHIARLAAMVLGT